MHRQRFLSSALVLLTILRFAMLPVHELSPDEALAHVAAGQAGWNWLEVGPLMPCLAAAGTWVFGATEFGMRCFAPLLAAAASLCVWRLAKGMFDVQTASWSVVILNVMPAFNLAAITMTPATISFAAVATLMLCLRVALHSADKWHPGWFAAAGCLALAVWADARHMIVLLAVALALGISRRRRHHLLRRGFGVVCSGWLIAVATWTGWNHARGWPALNSPFLQPDWRIGPNVLRWLLMASPLLLPLLLGAVARASRMKPAARPADVLERETSRSRIGRLVRDRIVGPLRSADVMPHHALLLGFCLPLMILDFGWGGWERWPSSGFFSWTVPAAVALAWAAQQNLSLTTSRKIAFRSVVLAVAGLQSALLMQTDMVRSRGFSWPLATEVSETSTYSRFFSADPSAAMLGWKQSARIVREMEAAAGGANGPWFIVADNWPLAACLAFYTEREAPIGRPFPDHPAVHVHQCGMPNPFAFWPRYDKAGGGKPAYRGMDALFVSDRAQASKPPTGIVRSFDRFQILSIADIMHGGQKARTLKIFACHGYRATDL